MKYVLLCCFAVVQLGFNDNPATFDPTPKPAAFTFAGITTFSKTKKDTSNLDSTFSESLQNDSSDSLDEKAITNLLETARSHYLAALQSFAEGDSVSGMNEFELSIQHLNEAIYYPEIESNDDFNELSRSVVEDYEKYIAVIDSLGPQSSIFALREKINLEIEKIDITNIQIPPSLIPQTSVPLDVNEYTKRAIAFFMGKGRPFMENWIYRSGKYFPMMKRIFAEEGLPEELMYLAMPESGLNPVARSWAKAVGMWQFMKSTGALYGLRSNYWYDERRDFEKATRAAARHMKDLYEQYNNWHLVFVAYNAGAGWVNRGIRRTGSKDYWEMRHKLPRETRNYVPQYIAVTLMAMRPEAFGLDEIQKADSLSFEVVTVDDCVDLAILAECVGTTVEILQDLNPELTQWCTPPGYKGYQLRVPHGTSAMFAENYAKIPEDKKMDFATHTIRKGETLSRIASKYGLNTTVLLEVNKLSRRSKLRIGATLIIPVKSQSVAAIVDAQRKRQALDEIAAKKRREAYLASRKSSSSRSQAQYEPAGRKKIVYKVNKGETLGHIAEWFGVRASHIRNWNNIPYGRYIRVGQSLSIWVPEEKYEYYRKIAGLNFSEKQRSVKSGKSSEKKSAPISEKGGSNWVRHKVKRGETLEKIAEKYDVAIADIKSWNRLVSSRILAGAYLEILADDRTEGNDDENGNGKHISQKTAKITYVVRRGDTLEKIANKYSVTISEVKRWNNLSGSRILVGQKLVIQLTDNV